MAESITFSVSHPPACLSPNSRAHWRTENAAKQAYATEVWASGVGIKGIKRHRLRDTPELQMPWEQAAVHLTWYSTHQKDQDNIIAHCKGLIDGLSTKGTKPLGLFVDDKNITVTAEWAKVSKKAEQRVEVTVTRRNP